MFFLLGINSPELQIEATLAAKNAFAWLLYWEEDETDVVEESGIIPKLLQIATTTGNHDLKEKALLAIAEGIRTHLGCLNDVAIANQLLQLITDLATPDTPIEHLRSVALIMRHLYGLLQPPTLNVVQFVPVIGKFLEMKDYEVLRDALKGLGCMITAPSLEEEPEDKFPQVCFTKNDFVIGRCGKACCCIITGDYRCRISVQGFHFPYP